MYLLDILRNSFNKFRLLNMTITCLNHYKTPIKYELPF